MDDRFVRALGDAFPERSVPEHPVGEPWLGDRNGTVCTEFDDGERVFCKVAVDGEGSRLDEERAVLEFVTANADVVVPRVLACDPEPPVPYIVTAPIGDETGAAAADPSDEAKLQALGRTLATLHDLAFDAHGEIKGGGAGGLVLDQESWTDVYVDQIRGIPEFAHSEAFDRHVEDVVVAVEANRDLLDAAPARLVHGDPHMGNYRYDGADIGLFDWELAHVGDPVRDLRRVLEQEFGHVRPEDPEDLVEALHEGYRQEMSGLPEGYDERTRVYEAVRALVDGIADERDEPRAELVQWVETELERRLEPIR